MEWHRHFQTVFFKTWLNAGLPDHENFLSPYYLILEERNKNIEWIDNSAGIDHRRLYDVYGFGATVGKMFGAMFGLTAEQINCTSDWCGRFNLGISLFDYISDELDGVTSVSSLKVFQPFTKDESLVADPSTSAEELVSNLAASVLQDVENFCSNKIVLLKLLQQMFEAEDFISTTKLSTHADLTKINKALYLKSAGPFKAMAEYTASIKTADDFILLRNASAVGNALGHCYWLIDDAKDVWDDLEAGQWNVFLQLAAEKDPLIFSTQNDAEKKERLHNCWEQWDHAEIMSGQIIKELADAVGSMELPDDLKNHTLGIISASLWQWYHS